MSRSSTLFTGLFGTFALSCVALVLAPQAQLGSLTESYTEDDPGKYTDIYPIQHSSDVAEGRSVYAREGCIACHTQQVRDPLYKVVALKHETGHRKAMRCWLPHGTGPAEGCTEGEWMAACVDEFEQHIQAYRNGSRTEGDA